MVLFELPFFDTLDIANAISRKALGLDACNNYQLIGYNEKIIWLNLKKKKKNIRFLSYCPLKNLTSQFRKCNI